MNLPLTSSDLTELEELLTKSGVGEAEDIRRAAQDAQVLGLLVRSLVGMDRAAAKDALARFTNGRTLTANQLEFVSLIVDHLTENGVVGAAQLYESPFTDITPHGPDALFRASEMEELFRALEAVRATAVAA
jgi:type I restriction enzyme R subunit